MFSMSFYVVPAINEKKRIFSVRLYNFVRRLQFLPMKSYNFLDFGGVWLFLKLHVQFRTWGLGCIGGVMISLTYRKKIQVVLTARMHKTRSLSVGTFDLGLILGVLRTCGLVRPSEKMVLVRGNV